MWQRSALMLGAAMVIGTMLVSPAAATKQSGKSDLVFVDYGENEGNWTEWWVDEEDRTWVLIYKNYEIVDVVVPEGINPGPDGDEGAPGDLGTLIQLLKQHGGRMALAPAFAKTPLGKRLTEQGKGIVPVHNPADLGFEDSYGEGYGSGGGFNPGGGTPQEQVKRKHAHGKGNGGKGDDGSDLKATDVGLFDDDMPGPPDLVNPNPVGKITEGGTHGEGGAGGAAGGGGHGGSAAAGH
jgi:hypothetical protein